MSLLIERRIVGVACESTTCDAQHELDVDTMNTGALRAELQILVDSFGWVFHLESKRRAYCPVHHDALFTRCTCSQKHRVSCPIHYWDDFIGDVIAPERYLTRHSVPGGRDLVTALLTLTIDGQWIPSSELLTSMEHLFGICSSCNPTLRQLALRLSELDIYPSWDSPSKQVRGYCINHNALEEVLAGRNK